MDFWFAIYISFCQLLILLSSFTQFQRCLNVPGCLMRHFPTSFFGRLLRGGDLYSQGTTTQLTFLLNYRWNIYIQISILQQIDPPYCLSVFLQYMYSLSMPRFQQQRPHPARTEGDRGWSHVMSTFPYYTALAKHLLCVNLSEEKVELGRISTNITKRRS